MDEATFYIGLLHAAFLSVTLFMAVVVHRTLSHMFVSPKQSNKPPVVSESNRAHLGETTKQERGPSDPFSMAAPSSSSSTVHLKKHDVFISFRGEDTRRNFTSHLRGTLLQKQVQTYVDDRLNKGDEISSTLLQAIEESHISIVVFSQDYASSKWCLDELVKILECRNKKGQDVIPVFYNVDPSHVRKQSGSYKEAFAKHERVFKKDQGKLNKWKHALSEAANLVGWDSRMYGDESKLIHDIVEDVLRKLENKYLPMESKCPLGIKENLAPIESLLRDVQTIGIWGMGGIGKTTIANWLFDKYSYQYEGSYFLRNIREDSIRRGLHDLRKELVSKLLGVDERTINVESLFVKHILCRKRVFIVLDDVSDSKQLECLVEQLQHYGSSSKIIITTRDKHVLSKRVDAIHMVEALNFEESFQLFNLKAFNQNYPMTRYEELSARAVGYAKGVPLALEVLGSFLRSTTKDEWESALMKLKQIPHEDIQRVLILSFDGLNDTEKEIFLDIACFLKGKHQQEVKQILDSFDFFADIGLKTLQNKALIIIEGNYVWMHDLIQEMGWEIVRQESIKEPGRRSRLWDPKEVYDVLKYTKETHSVEGISLDMSEIREIHLTVATFKKMTKLRFFRFYSLGGKSPNVHLSSGLHLFSDRLRYLEWDGYPSKSLPLTFCPEKLVELSMPDSDIEKLWDGVQDLVNLKRINLSGSKRLTELPDLSKASNLEEVDLSYCKSLCHVHPSLLSLHSLVTLKLESLPQLPQSIKRLLLSGSNIKYLPTSIKQLTELVEIDLGRCKMLRSLPELPQFIKELYLDYSNIECLPTSVKKLTKLCVLCLNGCTKLRFIPELPQYIHRLDLRGSSIEYLPANLSQLVCLIGRLDLSGCTMLQYLQELPPSIRVLYARGCRALTRTSTLWKNKYSLCLYPKSGKNLDEDEISSIWEDTHSSIKRSADDMAVRGSLANYFEQRSKTAWRLNVCLPGSRVPEWFKNNRATEASITIELDRPSQSQLVAFAFCVVISPSFINQGLPLSRHTTIRCHPDEDSFMPVVNEESFACWETTFCTDSNSDHVYLWCHPTYSFSDKRTITFKFDVILRKYLRQTDLGPYIRIKECGVYPIYISEEGLSGTH